MLSVQAFVQCVEACVRTTLTPLFLHSLASEASRTSSSAPPIQLVCIASDLNVTRPYPDSHLALILLATTHSTLPGLRHGAQFDRSHWLSLPV